MVLVQPTRSGEADLLRMAALARAYPADHRHRIDLPYRFSSWALDDPGNVALWEDEGGHLLAWAVLQAPFWTIDSACHPAAGRKLFRQLLDWADHRARELLGTPSGHPSWFVNVFARQAERIRDLEAAGFSSQQDVGEDSWSKVWMRLSAPPEDRMPPAGFTLRPLEGPGEIERYVELHRAVFESRSMTAEWRARTLRRPEYIPDLDLVAEAPDGRLAAFCICWLGQEAGQPCGQVEPLGVHADYRGTGLGRAILAEGLRRLFRHGARQIYVETDSYRNAALALYEAAGFRVIEDVLVFRRDYGEVDP